MRWKEREILNSSCPESWPPMTPLEASGHLPSATKWTPFSCPSITRVHPGAFSTRVTGMFRRGLKFWPIRQTVNNEYRVFRNTSTETNVGKFPLLMCISPAPSPHTHKALTLSPRPPCSFYMTFTLPYEHFTIKCILLSLYEWINR